MSQNNILGLCIITYNRENDLKNILDAFLDEAIKFNIPIYISDNNSTDNTEQIVKEFQKKYGIKFITFI